MTKEMINNLKKTEAYQELLNDYCDTCNFSSTDFDNDSALSDIFYNTKYEVEQCFPELNSEDVRIIKSHLEDDIYSFFVNG